jgi:uncharacterized protein
MPVFLPAAPFSRSLPLVPQQDTAAISHEKEIQAWHERRIASLKRDHGWLSLIALDWLEEGRNEVPSIGTLTLQNRTVSFEAAPNVEAKLSGKPFSSGVLTTDVDKDGPDKVEIGSRAFIIIKRSDRYALRMWDSSAEARKRFTGIERFPVSGKWRIEAQWESYDPPKKVKVPSVIPDQPQDYVMPGVASFTIGGKEYRLKPVLEAGTEDLFFIFGDKTNGKDTYGGGRFLYSKPPKDGKLILDFNKAYNPPCAFTPYATCPLPLESNRLDVRIEAGEKVFTDH